MSNRIKYLFSSTNGLVLMAIAIISIIAAIWGTLSGPMVEMGVRDITVKVLGMKMVEAEREGRVIMLYHVIAMAVIAILVYLITANVRMDKKLALFANALVTAGYLIVVPAGLLFAYFGRNWVMHGMYVFGLSMIFLSGLILAVALWPWNKKYYLEKGSPYAHLPSGLDLERVAFWAMTLATLGSAALGGMVASYFGNGFEVFLAEDTIRHPVKNHLQLSIVGHLHIMLALMGIAITLVMGRWLDFKGIWHKIAMPSMVLGTITLTIGAWAVVPAQNIAHTIIYVGAVFSMSGGLFLVIYGMPKLVKDRLQEQGLVKATFWQKTMALFHDPLKFGVLWQMIFMNFTTSFVGIFMAIRLTEIFRVWPHREERIELAGHWHILSAIIAIMILFYFLDRIGLKGRIRQWFGWTMIIASDLAFAAITVFEMKRLFVTEYMQQPVVNLTMILTDIGLGLILILLAGFLIWRIIDLFKSKGLWIKELEETDIEVTCLDETTTVQSKQESGREVSQ
ncbi:MAG: hypothetical protein APF76_03385 [Desulfitibacter sp. BRH_c19]|nr:MAG: hypothetical protein APF76_03385 [Desulfitibacter sp. BRH_c19]